jgi:catechol 2,3-dioxygenase-like lactoylglutathione lyase family enzyme
MTVQLDHTIVHARDKQASAEFLAEVFGLPAPVSAAPFVVVEIDHGVSLDFGDADDVTPQHYAFRVEEQEFDAIFARIRERAVPYWADPSRRRAGEIAHRGSGRACYFEDPSGHLLEVLTLPERAR